MAYANKHGGWQRLPREVVCTEESFHMRKSPSRRGLRRGERTDHPWRSRNSSCQAIWMASSLASLEAAGSPEKPGSSVIHLCMSVKRTVSGSVSGNLSVRAMATSSKLSQPNVGGMCGSSVIQFLGVIFVPIGNFHDDVCSAVGDGLAAEARLRRDAGGFVEFVKFGVGGFVAGLEAFAHDDVARRAGTNAAAGVIEASFESFGDI